MSVPVESGEHSKRILEAEDVTKARKHMTYTHCILDSKVK